MDRREHLQRLLTDYLERYPDEAPRLENFIRFVRSFEGADLYDRKNFAGHITAGALVVSREGGKVLLLRHRQLGKWLQPGGHVDVSDLSVFDAALREVREETGIGPDRLVPLRFCADRNIVLADADGHYIPSCEWKNEKEHYHFDLRFGFLVDGDPQVVVDRSESDGFRWVGLEELGKMPDFGRVVPKIRAALSRNGVSF